ncbi:MAG: efflux RND transporter periplasmic adaptor subunit [Verrucomicrobiales bacterium]|nr:efflux RND transporter periplasmic adaptor subunit [Verrucomicrobiales bacterium]
MSAAESNYSIQDLSAARPRLRSDLQIHFQDGGYVLEDPIKGNFFSIGAVEYRFLQLLDGTRTVAAAVGQLSVEAEADALPEEAALALIRSFADADLMEGSTSEKAEQIRSDLHRKQDGNHLLQRTKGILFCRFPLGNPDRLLTTILPWVSWLVSPGFFLIWCLVVSVGAISLMKNWNRFSEEMSGMFEVGNLFLLGVIWVLLKIFHEGWHAVACKKFGGSVPEIGVVLLLFITPLGYVNATSATRFSSRWKRIFVSAAGIYGELFAAGLAAIIWARLDPGILSRGLHEVIVISSITTILFNANPLMRFDGYFILSDLTGVANLYTKAQQRASAWFRRIFLGASPAPLPSSGRDSGKWITLYGVAASIWRFLIVFGILAFVSQSWKGAGMLIAVFVIAATLLTSIQSGLRYFRTRAAKEKVSPFRAAIRITATLAVLASILFFVQIKPGIRVPAVVDWQTDGDIRVDCPGFLDKLYIENGAIVKKGDLLATIKNPDELARIRKMRFELKQRQIEADKHRLNENISAYQAELEQIDALQVRLKGEQNYINSLHLKAKCDGVVYGNDLANLVGTYVDKGKLICTVGSPEAKQLIVAIPEEKSDALLESVGASATFRARGRIATTPSILQRINATASIQIPHFSLATPAGGPLVSRRIPGSTNAPQDHSDLTGRFELTKPHFEARAHLDPASSSNLEVGEVGYLKIHKSEPIALAQILGRKIEQAYRHRGHRE